ncbi:hypothetical protein OPV22_008554 [Ensete ventricosum]|uniref:Uncharacterized protein n=1 Tax=Ensete ventricosum TaxID=4639 RepID=A0AAV8RH93_ENSVE|nr:hypothetical protein OPV22_008554 [Ensete ventricosum]
MVIPPNRPCEDEIAPSQSLPSLSKKRSSSACWWWDFQEDKDKDVGVCQELMNLNEAFLFDSPSTVPRKDVERSVHQEQWKRESQRQKNRLWVLACGRSWTTRDHLLRVGSPSHLQPWSGLLDGRLPLSSLLPWDNYPAPAYP